MKHRVTKAILSGWTDTITSRRVVRNMRAIEAEHLHKATRVLDDYADLPYYISPVQMMWLLRSRAYKPSTFSMNAISRMMSAHYYPETPPYSCAGAWAAACATTYPARWWDKQPIFIEAVVPNSVWGITEWLAREYGITSTPPFTSAGVAVDSIRRRAAGKPCWLLAVCDYSLQQLYVQELSRKLGVSVLWAVITAEQFAAGVAKRGTLPLPTAYEETAKFQGVAHKDMWERIIQLPPSIHRSMKTTQAVEWVKQHGSAVGHVASVEPRRLLSEVVSTLNTAGLDFGELNVVKDRIKSIGEHLVRL